jgi:hypothetical protein
VVSVQCQLSPKMSNLSDTCHLLVMPHQHDDVMLTSPVIPFDTNVDFDPVFFFLSVCEFDQNAITFAYSVHLRKTNIWSKSAR